ncbi:Outer membrane protein (porin) [Paraburkholderia caballeronis]|uniref:Outer membrane protein (Porin) n=2 Tax=Paraburkholderia caballeronis TaxID=416943 RepID=A0A1H7T046_9BURK|nr:putative porin [Paraburkholderia caballeronis]PXX01361.1 putative porin [Paraburkholderia caballeronis]RAJ99285.1 putative porin [Paraburkholderia caballeronis]SEE23938.1 Outer membrane protein (porin) [Paraburkholderia caballeronis]SEL77915.1 Outer membrane protein (porin) [Paraburkholderia caballeronis]
MKKRKIFVSAALLGSATSVTYAQSSVTIYGVLDAAVTYAHASGAGSKFSMDSSGLSSSKFGLIGTEDLGGGLSAGFTLEGDIYPTNGTGGTASVDNTAAATSSLFGRRSFVSLKSKQYGEIRLGRDFSPTYWNLFLFDPFVLLGVGSSSVFTLASAGVTAARTSNSVFYLTPDTLGGFFAEGDYAFGNKPYDLADGTGHDGNFAGLRLGYEGHDLRVAAAMSNVTYKVGDIREINVGGTYDFKIIKAYGLYQNVRVGSSGRIQSTYLLGGMIPVGPDAIRFSVNRLHEHGDSSRDAMLFAVGYIYNLSKRTSLYGTAAFMANHSKAAYAMSQTSGALTPEAGGNDTGVQFGIVTRF